MARQQLLTVEFVNGEQRLHSERNYMFDVL